MSNLPQYSSVDKHIRVVNFYNSCIVISVIFIFDILFEVMKYWITKNLPDPTVNFNYVNYF
jgi:hypothetical protein